MYSPYAALASNQRVAYAQAANNRNNQYNNKQSNFDYYDYYDYGNGGGGGGISNQAVNKQQQFRQNFNQQRQFAAGGNNIAMGVNRRMSNMKAAASGGFGSYSGDDYCDNGISIGLLLTAALGIAVMFYTLYTKITMAGGRRRKKRSEAEQLLEDVEEEIDPLKYTVDHFTDFVFSGNYSTLFLAEHQNYL